MIAINVVSVLKNKINCMTPGEAFDWLLLNPGKHVYGVCSVDWNNSNDKINAFRLNDFNYFLISEIIDPYNTNFNWYVIENYMFSCNVFYTPEQYESALLEIERIKNNMNLEIIIGLGFNYN